MAEIVEKREKMILHQLKSRGIKDKAVLNAMTSVPREAFVGVDLAEFAYEDAPLPIEEGQTISQPYIVAAMIEALQLDADDRVLEVGTGSGYAAAILAKIAKEVYTIERHRSLAYQAAKRLDDLGFTNVHVLHGDGTLGWPEYAPFDAIIVAAGGPDAPRALIEQLVIGGRMVIPAGPTHREQKLVRITRTSENEVEVEDLGAVRFVPLIGEQGWKDLETELRPPPRKISTVRPAPVSELIERAAEHIPSIESVNLDPLLDRIGDARVVLLGEATHGTAEFYDMRARITRELIEKKGFTIVAVEADWPDAAQIDHFVRDTRIEPTEEPTFTRFPTWMWANAQVLAFAQWLRHYNQRFDSPDEAVGFYGLDLYSMYSSIDAVIRYLEEVDPKTAEIARRRYDCLSPWEGDPATYGRAATTGRHRGCEPEVVQMLSDVMQRRLAYAQRDGRRYLDALANARLVKNAERYYRVMYQGSRASWNLRDTHMFEALTSLLESRGPDARAVVWAHNSHIGDAAATEMGARGEINIGHLCRKKFGDGAYLIGFGTDHGTVAAASDWGAPMEIKRVRPSHPESYERLCNDAGLDAFLLPLRDKSTAVVEQLIPPRLQRAIGVIYRPETEIQSHYFQASLPHQFDEYIWFNETQAVSPMGPESGKGMPDTFPFGL